MDSGPVLQTRLLVPPPRAGAVLRPALSALVGQKPLTLIAAPAGYGKTTLAAQRLQSLPPTQRAWLSLDLADNDPARFVRYLTAALQPALSELKDADPHDQLEILINTLVNASHRVLLVLDEYEVITAEAIHQALAFLINHCPPTLGLILTTRTNPPLPLARLRARHQLQEIGLDQLRFSSSEASQFLTDSMQVTVSDSQAASLQARTEGWPGGLQLAALSLQSGSDLSQLSGSHPHLTDYLLTQVFERQSPATQSFLLRTSILPRLNAANCAALLTQSDIDLPNPDAALFTLIQLKRENLFVIALDETRQWYRYHPLFAEFLLHRLQTTQPQLFQQLHLKAGQHLIKLHQPAEAFDHFLAAQELEKAVQLLHIAAARWIQRGEFVTLLSKLSTLPIPTIHNDPNLCLWQAWALTLSDRLDEAEPWLSRAETHYQQLHQRAQTESPESDGLLWNYQAGYGQVLSIRATLAFLQQDYALAQQHAQQALDLLPNNDLVLPAATNLILGQSYLAQRHAAQALPYLQKAYDQSRAANHAYIHLNALLNLARAENLNKQPQRAQKLATQALRFATEQQIPSLIRLAQQAQTALANPALSLPDPLTAHELEILRLLEQGLPNQAIADELIIAVSTVRWHIKHIYRKLNVHNRAQAAHRARELGLL